MTLEMLNFAEILVRFEHVYESNEDVTYSKPAQIALRVSEFIS